MKQFISYTVLLLLITFGWMCLGEWAYTYVYNSGSYRDKVMWARDIDENTPLDYVVLGNSISHYGIDPRHIEQETGKKGLNFSYNSSHPYDMFSMLQTIIDRNPVSRVYIQLDHSYRTQTPDEIGTAPWLPYLKEPKIYNWYKSQGTEYKLYRHIPFYRYQKYGAQIGLRNVLLSAAGKTPEFLPYDGFKPMNERFMRKNFEPFIISNTHNPGIDAMIQLASDRNIELEFFTSPVIEFEGDYSVLKNRVPNYTNFANRITDTMYFMDEIHLNREGARVFTDLFIHHYFK